MSIKQHLKRRWFIDSTLSLGGGVTTIQGSVANTLSQPVITLCGHSYELGQDTEPENLTLKPWLNTTATLRVD